MDNTILPENKHNINSQYGMLRTHFLQGNRVTGLEASIKFGISHLPRRILDLKESGMILLYDWVKVKKANGKMAKVKQWRYEGESKDGKIVKQQLTKNQKRIIVLELDILNLQSKVRELKRQIHDRFEQQPDDIESDVYFIELDSMIPRTVSKL